MFLNSTGATGVAMVEIDAETIIEMQVVLVQIGETITVGIVHDHTEGFNREHFMYYVVWSEGFVVFYWRVT